MSGFLSVTNWRRYQHYKDRTPIWIKFHVEVLHDEKLKKLPLSTRLLWDQMLLLAAMFQNAVPNSPELIGNLTGIPPDECREGVELLLKGRWLREKQTRRSASKAASLDKEGEKNKEEKARAKAVKEAAEKFVRSVAHWAEPETIAKKLRDEYAITDDLTIRRLLTLASELKETSDVA